MIALRYLGRIVFLAGILFCLIKIVNPLNMGGQYEVALPLFDDGLADTENILEYTDDWNAQRPYGLHRALDVRGALGTPVFPVADGTVAFINEVPVGTIEGAGNTVIINHGNGNYSTYSHLDTINDNLYEGASVTRGSTADSSTQVGTVGETGHAEGVHLHLQFRQLINPQTLPSTYQEAANASQGVTTPQQYGDPDNEGMQHHEGDDGGTGGGDDSWNGEDGEAGREGGETGGPPDGGEGVSPGNDCPDDNESFSSGNPAFLLSDPKSGFYRLAVKKENTFLLHYWNFKELLKERDKYFESLASGGTPNETYLNNLNSKINTIYNLLTTNEPQFSRDRADTPDVLILRNGYFRSTSSLTNKFQEAWLRIRPSFSSLWVKDNSIFVIPSGGYFGLDNSDQFKSMLNDYVYSGGTLIVFAQQHGYEYSFLPTPDGRTIGAYGWREDQSCWMKSIYVDTWHPALSSVTTPDVSVPVDGYISDYPSDATVLLRRTRNGEPALMTWQVGAGHVIASSLFTDYQGCISDQRIVRDLITWAKNPNLAIPEYNLGQNAAPEVSLNLEIKNISEIAASKAKLFWLDPDRNVMFEEERFVSIPSGETLSLPVSHTFSGISYANLGIWHVDYELYDAQDSVIQPQAETDSGRFAVSNPSLVEYEPPEISLGVTAPEEIIYGTGTIFTAHISNHSSIDNRIRLYRYWSIVNIWDYWTEVVVPANSTIEQEITLVPPRGTRGFWVFAFEENGKENDIYKQEWWGYRVNYIINNLHEAWPFVNYANKGIRFFKPSIKIDVQTDKQYYQRRDPVNIKFILINLANVAFDPIINIRITDSLNQLIFQDLFTAHLEAAEIKEEARIITIPEQAEDGVYLISTEAFDPNQIKIGNGYSSFKVAPFYIKSEVQFPPIFQTNSSNIVSFVLSNTGQVDISAGVLDVKLLDPQDHLIFQGQQNFSLLSGQSNVMNFTISLSDLINGDYKLIYILSDEFNINKPIQKIIPAAINIYLNFDKRSYMARDEMNMSLNLFNRGDFIEAISAAINIPSFQFNESKPITLNPGQTGNLSYSTIVPPASLSGLHSVDVTLTLPSGSEMKKVFHFTIPKPNLIASFDDEKDYSSGGNLNLNIFNSGGTDTYFKYHATLIDLKTGKEIYIGSIDGVLQAGSTILRFFTIPSQAVKSSYLVKLELEDLMGNKLKCFKSIDVYGLEADLEVLTDKYIYLNTENITALSKVINSDKDITDGTLHLQVVNKEKNKLEEWKNYLNPLVFPIETITIDNDNNVWIGVNKIGAVKFDGDKWKTYLNESSHLSGDYVNAIVQDHNDNLWFGTYLSGVRKFDGTNWTTYNRSNSGLASNQITAIAPDGNGSIWFGTWGQGVSKFNGTNWTTYNSSNSGLAGDSILSLAIDNQGNLWVGASSKGTYKFDGTSWTNYNTLNSGLAGNSINTLAMDGRGNIWFGTNGQGVSKFDGTNWTTYNSSNSGLAENRVYDIEMDLDGSLWFGTYNGANKFDGTRWILYRTNSSGLAYNYVTDIEAGKDGKIWFGTGSGTISNFDGTNWTTFTNTDIKSLSQTILSIYIDKDNNKWFGTPKGVSIFDGSNWDNYTTFNSGLVNNDVHAIVQDNDGNMWFGTEAGVSKFDGINWKTYNRYNSGLAGNIIYDIALDLKGNIWFAAWSSIYMGNGVSKFDGTNWTTYNASNSGLLGNQVKAITIDGIGNVWFTVDLKGISKFDGTNWTNYTSGSVGTIESISIDKIGNFWIGTWTGALKFDGTNWTKYTASIDGLADNRVFDITADENNSIWFGLGGSKISKFDGTNWTTYTPTNSGLIADNDPNQYIFAVAIDKEQNKWFGTSSRGASRYREVQTGGIPLLEKNFPVNQTANTTKEFSENIGRLDYTGKLYLVGRLLSSTGQILSESVHPFYLTDNDTVLLLSLDKSIYQRGDTISIQGEVKNLAPIELSNAILRIEKQSFKEGSAAEEVYGETFNVPAQASYPFSFTISASEDGTFGLSGIVTQNNLEIAKTGDQYHVLAPNIIATVTAPEVVGLNPFEIAIELKNTGSIDGRVALAIQPGGFSQEIVIPAGETKLVTSTQQIIQTTAFQINFTGDYTDTISKNVLYGLGAQIAITPQAAYAEGRVEIPVKVTNTGILENQVNIDFTLSLNGTPITPLTKSYYVPFNQSLEDTLVFTLTPGTYLLGWTSAYGSSQINIQVKPSEQMAMTAELGTQTEGAFPLNVNLANNGFNEFSGALAVESDVYSSLQDVTLASGSSSTYPFAINPQGIPDGKYTLTVRLLRVDNTEVQAQAVALTITKPHIELASLPIGLTFSIGENATFPFGVKNTGSQEGKASLKVEIMDMENTEEFYLGAAQEKELAYTYLLPGDLPEGEYTAKYTLSQEGWLSSQIGEFKFKVQGIGIEVGAQLDKSSYRVGETARLTLSVSNKTQISVELFAKVNYGDYEEEQSFTLENASSLVFDIPLPQITEEKVFYGIYHKNGRGIHLNDIYIYQKGEGADVELNRQVYEPGSNVLMAITTPKAGLMRISGPGYEEAFAVEGSVGRSFALPSSLQAGTYFLSWEFTPADGSGTESSTEMFDVAGLKVVVTEASLAKGKYAPGETVEAAIVFESNRNVAATLKMWVVDPEGRDTEAASSPVTLSSAEHTIVRESFSFNTAYAGMHSVVYGLYDASNQLLVSGSEAFDCGGAVVLAVGTEKSEYPLATEEVKTRIQLYGDGQANLLLFINSEPVKTVGAELSGVTTEEVTLEPSLLKPGHLTLRAELQRDNLLSRKETSFTYGSELPDLMIGGLVSSRNIWAYTIQAEVSNQGQTAAGPTAVSFFEGDPAQGGLLIAERPVVGLAAGESAQVEIAWSGQAKSGAREIWAVVDQAHAVREFNEDNNTASLSLDIPEIVHELKLEKAAFSAFEDMTMITLIANNRETPVQGQWKLKIVSLAPLPDVWEAEGEISAIAPYGQSLSSHVFNWGSNPEGEYRVSQIVMLDGSVFEDQVVVTVLRTEKISAAFTLDPAKISPNREESVNVELDLQNRGNVAIENGILSLEVLAKETGLKAAEKEWEFNLGITESRKETKILTLNLAEGFYTVKLLYKGEVLDEKELEAKVQISYTKQESLAPRVLVLANPLSLLKGLLGDEERNKIFQERVLIEEALRNTGIFYKLETNPLLQIRELRSGKYNLTILVDIGPILPQVTQEIKERAWNGEGVIAILSLGLWPEFTEELFGLKVQGVRKNQVETIRTYATAISQEGAFGLKSDFLNLKAVDPSLILVGTKESDQKPAIALRAYGDGRAVAFGFNLTAAAGEPAYAALQNLLVESIRYLQPRQGNSGTITRLIPVELTFQNPTSSEVQLKVVEERPENVKIVAAEPEPGSLEPLTWAFTLEPSGFKYLTYTVELPDVPASYELKTNIVKIEAGRESPISTVFLTETVEKTIRETLLETITQFQQLPVSAPLDRLAVRLATANLTAVLNRDETRPFGYHLNLRNVLTALGEIEKIRTAETGLVRKRLIELMLAYERKTVEAEWAMNIGLIIDLQKLF